MWNTPKWSGAVLVSLALAACDRTPVEPMVEVESQDDAVVAAAVQDSWNLLPSAEELQLATLDALSTASSPAADALIFEAGDLEAEAYAAEQGGEPGVAETLTMWAENAYVDAALVVFGPTFAAQTVSNVEVAVDRVEAALAGRPASREVRGPIDRARGHVDRARSELSRGNDAAAVRDGIAAADALRDVSPEDRARHFVNMALRLLGKAKELAGPDVRPEIAEILREADAHCGAAVRALESGNWQVAVREAQKCADLAKPVIHLLSGGISDDRLEGHAIALVDHAEDLFNRAVRLAGHDPVPEVKRALDQADEYLRQAKEALAQEHWREAIRLARESAAISRRVIGFLTDDRPSDGLEARAEQAVQHAKDLFERATTLAGDPPRPEIAGYLGRARALIAQVEAALRQENWRQAIAKAHEASRILYHVIRLLSDSAAVIGQSG